MRAYVWTDKALTRHAGRFVWLSLDMEKARNAAARKQIGIRAFPTLYVVDPSARDIATRWAGGAAAPPLPRVAPGDGPVAPRGVGGPAPPRRERVGGEGEVAVRGASQGPALDALI